MCSLQDVFSRQPQTNVKSDSTVLPDGAVATDCVKINFYTKMCFKIRIQVEVTTNTNKLKRQTKICTYFVPGTAQKKGENLRVSRILQ